MHKIIIKTGCLLIVAIAGISNIMGQAKIDLQGHRGCRGLMPENTIEAMIKAIDLGVTTLEMDIVITKDKQVVLSHDLSMNPEISTKPDGSTINTLYEKPYNIYQMTYEDVSLWDVGIKLNSGFPNQKKMPAKKPLLSQVIDSVEAYIKKKKLKPVQYNIETKCSPSGDGVLHPAPEEFVNLLIDVISSKKIAYKTIVQSFDPRTIQIVNKVYPKIKTAYLFGTDPKKSLQEIIDYLGFKPHILSPAYKLVTEAFVIACKKAKMKVIVWTVNDESSIKAMADLHVDGIISDYPDRFSVLKNR
jgi:glycerophosphoryl diester phosphodiesterase